MIKIIFTDMDGTFLDSTGTYNKAYFKEVYRKMKEQNIIFVPCSGKQCERIEELFDDCGEELHIIGDSAARIKYRGKYIYEALLDNNTAKEIIKDFSAQYDVAIVACTSEGAYVKDTISEEDFKVIRHSYAIVKKIKDYAELTDNFIKVSIYDKKKRCFTILKDLKKYADRAYIVASEDAWIDITHKKVHKGAAIKWLIEHLHLNRAEAMGFGDGPNDIELINEVEYSFSVSNAVDELKEKSFFITKSNDEDGVLKTIDMILKLQEVIHE
ncbi:Cof-type HAD-IIB family hydrolase [Treponema phagedenis]|nr:Cof-type HAD-IIB family hydrolase [Treponema phagedenis]NVP23302.1 Cof-type HAD-IIB family hydrolase [Treponema phagedenis]QEJ94916.1 Cof-type HAD-IIB family hydrolase [Treponema phagedenis]QEK00816.1 Cof-type HAD-IIB family hydrolase [Treponema phagedenis]QEK05823.1 Cof-type HAD-IIB family hydrolase [Treponema phagedenis]QKS92194.1 Cof-type HAD-IIB family hydrolase [Treponema phagedenis]